MIIQILKSAVFFFILMFISVNLLGFFVRGLFSNPEIDKLKKESSNFIKGIISDFQSSDKWVNLFALILLIVYFYLLFRIWNIGIVVVAVMIMAGRLPDLIWEIKHGTGIGHQLMKKDILYYVSTFLPWLAFPVLYYSLYYF